MSTTLSCINKLEVGAKYYLFNENDLSIIGALTLKDTRIDSWNGGIWQLCFAEYPVWVSENGALKLFHTKKEAIKFKIGLLKAKKDKVYLKLEYLNNLLVQTQKELDHVDNDE